jgi:adenylate cyclase
VAIDGADAQARSVLGITLYMRGDHAGAVVEAQNALALSPNLAEAHGVLGQALIFSGRHQDGIVSLAICIRLDPRSPRLGVRLSHTAIGHYFCREYEAAAEAAAQATRSYPEYPVPYHWLAASLGQLGQVERAKAALDKVIAIGPPAFGIWVRQRAPWIRPEDHAHLLEGLRKAGWEG